jgi:hypothetical protein
MALCRLTDLFWPVITILILLSLNTVHVDAKEPCLLCADGEWPTGNGVIAFPVGDFVVKFTCEQLADLGDLSDSLLIEDLCAEFQAGLVGTCGCPQETIVTAPPTLFPLCLVCQEEGSIRPDDIVTIGMDTFTCRKLLDMGDLTDSVNLLWV